MKNRSLSVNTLVMVGILHASFFSAAQVTLPRTPSPAATVSQTIGISTITVKYSRPKVANRKIWGALVPYGWNIQQNGTRNPAPWRSGANENTVIQFSHIAKVEGQTVPAGTYGLFFVVNEDGSGEVVLSKDHRSWGNFFYDSKQDQLRAKIQTRKIPHTELLTCDFVNITKNSTELVLNWEQKQFPVRIEFAVDEIVMANAEEELKGPTGFNPAGFISAANYALLNNVNQERALVWIDRAINQTRSFQTLRIKSGLLKQTGKTDEGEKLMDEALELGSENEINNYGYQLLNSGDHDRAIEIFVINTQKNPKSANTWDSLGEAYATKGDKANAIKHFKKALSLNPSENVKTNSEKYLKQLGAL